MNQGVKCGQNFLGRALAFALPAIRYRSTLSLAPPLGPDVEPVRSWAQFLANNHAIRLALNVDCKFSNAFAVTVCDLS